MRKFGGCRFFHLAHFSVVFAESRSKRNSIPLLRMHQPLIFGEDVRSGRKSCRVNLTVLLSFEEKTDDARACA